MELRTCKNCGKPLKSTGDSCEDCSADRWGHLSPRKKQKEKEEGGKNTPVHALKMNIRAKEVLEMNGVRTALDISRRTDAQLLGIQGFGPFFLLEARRAVEKFGLFPPPEDDD